MPSQYEDVGNATVGANGVASILFACPGPPVRRLLIDSIAILCLNSTLLPICTVYDGSVASQGRVRASTHIGDRNTFESQQDTIFTGQQILVQWSAATPGATCNAVIRGTTT